MVIEAITVLVVGFFIVYWFQDMARHRVGEKFEADLAANNQANRDDEEAWNEGRHELLRQVLAKTVIFLMLTGCALTAVTSLALSKLP